MTINMLHLMNNVISEKNQWNTLYKNQCEEKCTLQKHMQTLELELNVCSRDNIKQTN